MRRVWVTVVCVALCGATNVQAAHAQKKVRKGGGQSVATSAQLAASMGELRWGMTRDELLKKVLVKTRGKYEVQIAKTKNPVEEDRLRTQLAQEIEAVNKGLVSFD